MTKEVSTHCHRRRLGAAFSLCAVASLALLASHPSSGTHGLLEVVEDEATHRIVDGVVHGGLIVTLVALIVSFQLLARMLGSGRAPVVIGLTCFCTGCGLLIASMVVDGLVTPAIATRLAGTDELQIAKALFLLIGTLVSILMPLGLLFQSAAILSWSSTLVRSPGAPRIVGSFGLVVAVFPLLAIFVLPRTMAAHAIFADTSLQFAWYLALGIMLFRDDVLPVSPAPGSG